MMISLVEDGRGLEDRELDRIRELVIEKGEVGAAAALKIARSTLARALAKLPLSRGTVALIRTHLPKE